MTLKRIDNQLLVITHLTQLCGYVIGVGSFLIPLILWLTNRDRVLYMDEQGKDILNFQVSIFIYCLISIPLILFFGLGVLLLILIGILAFIMPIVNAVRVSQGDLPTYPFTIPLFK